MRKLIPVLVSLAVGFVVGLLIGKQRPQQFPTPDRIVVNYPIPGSDPTTYPEPRTWQTLEPVPVLNEEERGLWWVKFYSGDRMVVQYRCRGRVAP